MLRLFRTRAFAHACVFVSAALLVSGCANVNPPARTVAAKRGPVCDTASGQATSFGQSTSRLYAETAMKQQAAVIRGELLQGGLRRIRVSRPVTDCQPLPGAFRGIGLAHCRSYAQICGQ
jgi:hypothetical protein